MHNIVVIGAGPVGANFALLAKRQGLSVSLMEAREGPSHETRSLALSHGSRDILTAAGVWGVNLKATEIHAIHTSQKGGFGRSLITREDGGVPALGYVLSYADLQTALDERLEQEQITVERGTAITAFEEQGDHVVVRYSQRGSEQVCAAAVVVLADGGGNLGKLPAIAIAEKDYGQAALLGHIVTDRAHRGTAYERFTPEGPAALLPHGGDDEYSMVWISSPERIEQLKTLDDVAFLAAFQQHFGHRAGRFTQIAGRRSYPLRLRTVSKRVLGNIAVIGNAAKYLKSYQWDEEVGGKKPDSDYYGGAGYAGGKSRPDLSNTAFFLEALKAAGAPRDDPAFKKALVFVGHCQNFKSEFNSAEWAAKNNDGSFVYTGANGGENRRSDDTKGDLGGYGSMTYAGIKSMIYCGVGQDDERMKMAIGWIKKNYTLDSNPGMPGVNSQRGLYYYYHTFAKTMDALGVDQFEDAKGVKHDWRRDLTAALAKRQQPEGGWKNENDRWMEGDPNLVTAYALMSLSYAKPKK